MKRLREMEKAELKNELDLAAVPAAIETRLRKVYAELPEEVPAAFSGPAIGREPLGDYEEVEPVVVRRKPLAVRCALGACGVLAFAAVLLAGLSFSRSPLQVGASPDSVSSLAPETSGQAEEESEDIMRAVSSQLVDSGYSLTVGEASCDGTNLDFTIEIHPPADNPYEVLMPGSIDEEAKTMRPMPRVTVDGTETEVVSMIQAFGENKPQLRYSLHLSLPQEPKDGSALQVSTQIDYLKAGMEGDNMAVMKEIPVDLQIDFSVTVTVNQDGAFVSQAEGLAVGEFDCVLRDYQGQDNGVSVLGVESTPEYIKLDLQVPVWGSSLEEALGIASLPKGTYSDCVLYTEDGEEIPANYDLFRDPEAEFEKMQKLKKGDMYPFTMGFDPAPEGCKKVILRVFEYHPDIRLNCKADMWEEDYKANLFAELTIDLETGEATPTETYVKEGYTKLDTEEYLNTYHTPGFTGGYYIQNRYSESLDNAANAAWSIHLRLCADVEQPDLEFRFFRNGELYDSIHASADQGTPGVIEIDGEVGYYTSEGENTFFTLDRIANWEKKVMRDMGFQTIPQWRIQVVMSGPEYPIPDKIQLVDGKTGEVLMDDVQEHTAAAVE